MQTRKIDTAIAPHRILHSSRSNEWYTPAPYIEAARLAMGGIDLDPASDPIANEIVQAACFYTKECSGLDRPWHGRIWLNPPYGRDSRGVSNQAIWSAYLLREYKAGRVSQAILLVSAATDRKWFQPLWDHQICFTDHRIRFYTPAGQPDSPTHGSALIYLGDRPARFCEIFSQFGRIATAIAP